MTLNHRLLYHFLRKLQGLRGISGGTVPLSHFVGGLGCPPAGRRGAFPNGGKRCPPTGRTGAIYFLPFDFVKREKVTKRENRPGGISISPLDPLEPTS